MLTEEQREQAAERQRSRYQDFAQTAVLSHGSPRPDIDDINALDAFEEKAKQYQIDRKVLSDYLKRESEDNPEMRTAIMMAMRESMRRQMNRKSLIVRPAKLRNGLTEPRVLTLGQTSSGDNPVMYHLLVGFFAVKKLPHRTVTHCS